MAMEFLRLDKQRLHPPDHLQLMVDFSDEEGYGTCTSCMICLLT